jgi:hypothetical protein
MMYLTDLLKIHSEASYYMQVGSRTSGQKGVAGEKVSTVNGRKS